MASYKIRLLEYKANNEGKHPIVLQVIKDRKRKVMWLGYYASKEEWDEDEKLPTNKHPNYRKLKVLIRNKLNAAEEAIIDFDDREKPFTAQDVINEVTIKEDSSSFKEYTENVIAKLEKLKKYGNTRVYQNTLNAFTSYLPDGNIKFNQINYKILKGFEEYLIEKGNKTNTVSHYLRTVRAIYNRAINEGITREEYYPFKNFKIKSEKTLKRAVKQEDIEKIKGFNISDFPHLTEAKDYFLFSYYNRGMSFIDIANLKVGDLKNGRINYTRKKTGQRFSIKVTAQSQEIIDKYSDLSDPKEYIFPIIYRRGKEDLDYRNAMRLMNKKLKKISKEIDIDPPLTTYVSRHTWATIAKRKGIPTPIIQAGLGHETEETTQIYLDEFEVEVLDDANEKIIE